MLCLQALGLNPGHTQPLRVLAGYFGLKYFRYDIRLGVGA
jgi:hypothetical protein